MLVGFREKKKEGKEKVNVGGIPLSNPLNSNRGKWEPFSHWACLLIEFDLLEIGNWQFTGQIIAPLRGIL